MRNRRNLLKCQSDCYEQQKSSISRNTFRDLAPAHVLTLRRPTARGAHPSFNQHHLLPPATLLHAPGSPHMLFLLSEMPFHPFLLFKHLFIFQDSGQTAPLH